jgi:hypothetical protein
LSVNEAKEPTKIPETESGKVLNLAAENHNLNFELFLLINYVLFFMEI